MRYAIADARDKTDCGWILLPMMSLVCLFLLFAFFSAALAQGEWITRAPMLTSRTEVAAVALGEKLYVIGGFGRNGEIIEEYDAVKDQWRRRASLPYALHHVGAATAQGKLYVIGGYNAAGQPLNTVLGYDPALDQWRKRSDVPTPRAALAGLWGRRFSPLAVSRQTDAIPTRTKNTILPRTYGSSAPRCSRHGITSL